MSKEHDDPELIANVCRELIIPEEWRKADRVRIHFEAVDYHTTVYIDKETFSNVDTIYELNFS